MSQKYGWFHGISVTRVQLNTERTIRNWIVFHFIVQPNSQENSFRSMDARPMTSLPCKQRQCPVGASNAHWTCECIHNILPHQHHQMWNTPIYPGRILKKNPFRMRCLSFFGITHRRSVDVDGHNNFVLSGWCWTKESHWLLAKAQTVEAIATRVSLFCVWVCILNCYLDGMLNPISNEVYLMCIIRIGRSVASSCPAGRQPPIVSPNKLQSICARNKYKCKGKHSTPLSCTRFSTQISIHYRVQLYRF